MQLLQDLWQNSELFIIKVTEVSGVQPKILQYVPKRRCLLRIQFGCVNATVFGATDCDCGPQIRWSLSQIQAAESGVFVYFQDHEGHGIGLAGKLKAVEVEKRKLRS
jgi:GTP cyclohydrolase II